MNANLIELMVKLRELNALTEECLDLFCSLDYGDVAQRMDLDVLTDSLEESSFDVKESLAIVECAVAEELEPSKIKVERWRQKWREEGYNNDGSTTGLVDSDEDDDGECVDEDSGIRCNKWGEPIFDGCMDAWDDDDEICTECDDDEDDETGSESNCGEVSRPKRSQLDDTVSNEAERTHKDTAEKIKPRRKLDLSTGILTSLEDDDSKKLCDGEWDVSKGMRLTITRKKGDSVHVVVPCKLEKNAKLHHFTNADGINMSAIYTEDEDGEFCVEEASCVLGDEKKMIAWWNELHGDKRK